MSAPGDDYSALADWCMVVDRKDDYRLARVRVFKQLEEWEINQWLNQQRQQLSNNSQVQSTELDGQVLFAFQALFEKSSTPGGIVSWGQRHEQRKNATNTMKSAIISSKNRDDFVAHLDKQAEETGSDSALIRKVLGMVLAEVGQHDKAVEQLKIAIELQPTDTEIHEALTSSYDKLKQPDAAINQMLTQVDFDRHNLQLYKQVADRLFENEELSERAVTSLIEAAPLEAENHQALAEFREKQSRWDAAIAHWQYVAKLRALEPNGLLKLAAAQIHEEQWSDAKATVKQLNQKQWPERFRQVDDEIRKLQALLPIGSLDIRP